MVTVILGIILTGIYNGAFADTLLISVILTVVAYIVGDIFIFRLLNVEQVKRNMIATVSDLVLAFLVIFLLGELVFADEGPVLLAAIFSALIIAVGEWFYHIYLDTLFFRRNGYEQERTM
ncbi:MAG: DUF2512 family protein [Bacillus sp. (in: firmicutes)]